MIVFLNSMIVIYLVEGLGPFRVRARARLAAGSSWSITPSIACPRIAESFVRAAGRGVRITIVVESPDRLEGQNTYSTLKALGEEVAACSTVYVWPHAKRKQTAEGRVGLLHVKCAVADRRIMFLSSANLTEYAFSLNMELGILITGGEQPPRVEDHFDRLIQTGTLIRA
jgi:phosphatidylserine/phosphatidylglycerophosphate/cardiolipin synthase-like enzyme